MSDIFRSQFRLPGDLYDQLTAASKKSGRSLNAELVHRLEQSFEPTPDLEVVDAWIQRWNRPEHKEELRTIVTALFKLAGPPNDAL